MAPRIEECPNVLCVEGYSDLHFMAECIESVGRAGVFIKQFNGRSELLTKLGVFITPSLLMEKRAIGVVVDADSTPAGTFKGFQALLQECTGQLVPASGHWIGDKPKIGLIVVPDETTPGELETLVWRSWAADVANSSTRTCVDAFEKCLARAGVRAKSPDKARLGAMLAFKNDEDPRLGPGARAKAFDLTRPELGGLRTFLEGFP